METDNGENSLLFNPFEQEKERLEIEKAKNENLKLELELKELKKRWWKKPQWWSAFGPALIAIITLIIAWTSGLIKSERLQLEIKNLEIERSALIKNINKYRDTITSYQDSILQQKRHYNLLVKNYDSLYNYLIIIRAAFLQKISSKDDSLNYLKTDLSLQNNKFQNTIQLISDLTSLRKKLENQLRIFSDSISNQKSLSLRKDFDQRIKIQELLKAKIEAIKLILEKLISYRSKMNELIIENNQFRIENEYIKMKYKLNDEDKYAIGIRVSTSYDNLVKSLGIPEQRVLNEFNKDFQSELRYIIANQITEIIYNDINKSGIYK